jgi:hypothetical protein
MRRILVVTLLLALIASTSLFSVEDSFTVTTDVNLIGYIKVSSSAISGNTITAYEDAGNFTTLPVSTSGEQFFSAYMTTLCNCRTGYIVSMSATPMISAVEGSMTSHINYTVGCNGHDVLTTLSSEQAATPVVITNSLLHLTGRSDAITLTVDATTFNAAVSGSYIGTVTFTFAAT